MIIIIPEFDASSLSVYLWHWDSGNEGTHTVANALCNGLYRQYYYDIDLISC